MTECLHDSAVRRIDASAAAKLAADPATLILDVRRPEAFDADSTGLHGAVPLVLVPEAQTIPDTARDRPILVYCLCRGEASSMRAALWLMHAGYSNVSVLRGGLPAWLEAGQTVVPVGGAEPTKSLDWIAIGPQGAVGDPMVAERIFLNDGEKPTRRDIAVVFVDMVDSTSLLFSHEPESALALFQDFMEVVVDSAVRHCGDIRDFEGDGAMLYFAGVGEALPAVFDLREALNARRAQNPELPLARFALTTGPVVVGYIGTKMRRNVAFIGPCVNAAARILRLAQPGQIVATDSVVSQGEQVAPHLSSKFLSLEQPQWLKGWQQPVHVFKAD